MKSLPDRVFRLEALIRRQKGDWEQLRRTFDTLAAVKPWLESIDKYPEHLQLVGIYRGDVQWVPVGLEQVA